MRLSNKGYLGIGTQYPLVPLDVGKGVSNAVLTYWNAGTNDGAYFIVNGLQGSSSFGMFDIRGSILLYLMTRSRVGRDLDSTWCSMYKCNVTLSAFILNILFTL